MTVQLVRADTRALIHRVDSQLQDKRESGGCAKVHSSSNFTTTDMTNNQITDTVLVIDSALLTYYSTSNVSNMPILNQENGIYTLFHRRHGAISH